MNGNKVYRKQPFSVHAPIEIQNNNDYEIEKQKALEAGYSLEQFEAIMNIPINKSIGQEVNSEDEPLFISSSDQQKVVSMARQQLGKPYGWGDIKDPTPLIVAD